MIAEEVPTKAEYVETIQTIETWLILSFSHGDITEYRKREIAAEIAVKTEYVPDQLHSSHLTMSLAVKATSSPMESERKMILMPSVITTPKVLLSGLVSSLLRLQ